MRWADDVERLVRRARVRRGAHLAVVNLRILLGFAFLPAGLKKVLGEPFTDPANTGPFHEFLHAFHATGAFYQFVGVVQLLAAALLLTQRHAVAGAWLALPVLTAIAAFCWSTQVYPTATVVTLMLAGNLALLAWELPRWRGAGTIANGTATISPQLWQRCGLAIFVVYVVATAASGQVYRPEGIELDEPAFYLLPLLALFPVVTWIIEVIQRVPRRQSRPGPEATTDSTRFP